MVPAAAVPVAMPPAAARRLLPTAAGALLQLPLRLLALALALQLAHTQGTPSAAAAPRPAAAAAAGVQAFYILFSEQVDSPQWPVQSKIRAPLFARALF